MNKSKQSRHFGQGDELILTLLTLNVCRNELRRKKLETRKRRLKTTLQSSNPPSKRTTLVPRSQSPTSQNTYPGHLFLKGWSDQRRTVNMEISLSYSNMCK